MIELFKHPEFLAVAGALISAPIIIHLINRMRFKRLRWAAMEFLLKAQKRNRRRLVIEQLILLAMRCLLVAMAGLLVLRFVGFSFADIGSKPALHIVLLDDTLSMNDQWKENENIRDAFQVAKQDVLFEKIAQSIGQAGAGDKLCVLMLSRLATQKDYQPKVFDKLNDPKKLADFKKELDQLEASELHVPLLQGVQSMQALMAANADSRVTLHILSDFREKDWALPEAEPLHKLLAHMVQGRSDLKIRMIDAVHPFRQAGQGGAPLSHENVGITDFRAGTRVAGKDMPVTFTVTLANFSAREAEVNLVVLENTPDQQPKERFDIDFSPGMPVKIPAGSIDTKVTFEVRFSPQIKAGETYFAHLSARLENAQRGKLENDGLAQDNIRHAAVEIRDKVPILIVDGEGARGRLDNMDSFFLKTAIISVPGSSYEVEYGDELGGGIPAKALERGDLAKYPTIFLANVRELAPKQLANLENYVRDGGGVCFFMGPLVNASFYNKSLYKEGHGLFPAPLKETFYPPASEEPLKPRYTGDDQVLLREDILGRLEAIPIFGSVFKDETQKTRLKDLPIFRYFQVPRTLWRPEPGKVSELATLPNDVPATTYQGAALDLVNGPAIRKIMENPEFKKYQKGLERHRRAIESIVAPTSEKHAFALAGALEALLQDKGNDKDRGEFPNLTEFWSFPDPKVDTLRKDVLDLRDQSKYGDPFVIAGAFGKGKVVAVMTTAGKEWNAWGGGSDAAVIYQPFIWELQNHLSSQGTEGNLTVGTPVQITVDPELFKQKGRSQLKTTRIFRKIGPTKIVTETRDGEQFGQEGKQGVTFTFDKNWEPGLYLAKVHFADASDKAPPLAVYAHVFNVDTLKEGALARIDYDDIDKNIIREAPQDSILFDGPNVPTDSLVARRTDLSQSPWFFLVFIALLVAEQALAVHLSFHLKGNQSDALGQAPAAKQQAA